MFFVNGSVPDCQGYGADWGALEFDNLEHPLTAVEER